MTGAGRGSGASVACIEVVEMLTDYLEGALPADESAAVEAHLQTCPPCRVYLDQLRVTIDVLGAVPIDTLSGEAQAALLAAFRSHRRG